MGAQQKQKDATSPTRQSVRRRHERGVLPYPAPAPRSWMKGGLLLAHAWLRSSWRVAFQR
jgi:hypothetical protein